jgi:hypothetical protein
MDIGKAGGVEAGNARHAGFDGGPETRHTSKGSNDKNDVVAQLREILNLLTKLVEALGGQKGGQAGGNGGVDQTGGPGGHGGPDGPGGRGGKCGGFEQVSGPRDRGDCRGDHVQQVSDNNARVSQAVQLLLQVLFDKGSSSTHSDRAGFTTV